MAQIVEDGGCGLELTSNLDAPDPLLDHAPNRLRLSDDGQSEEGDLVGGKIYVLQSKSTDPRIAEHRNAVHKIGITHNEVETQSAHAWLDPTYLWADVELNATYELFNVNRVKLEISFIDFTNQLALT